MNTRPSNRAWPFGLAAVALWSTVATAFKYTLGYLSPLELLWVASLSSWCFLLLAVVITRDWQALPQLPPRKIALGVLGGLLNPTLYYLLLFAAYARLPAQEAMAINYSWALTLALIGAPLLRQRISVRQWMAAGASYLGVLIIATRGDLLELQFDDPAGVGLAISSTLVWSAYWLINTRASTPALIGLLLNFSGGVVFTTGLMVLTGFRSLPVAGLLGGVYVGIFEMGASFVLWLVAMRRAKNTLSLSSLIFLSPPLSLLLIWLILAEPIRSATLAGLGFILVGLAAQQWLDYRSQRFTHGD